MTSLSRLFGKPPPPPPTLAERAGSLQAAPADVLLSTALGDAEEELRIAAIRLLPDGHPLRALAGLSAAAAGAPPAAVLQSAQARLAQLIDAQAAEFASLPTSP